MKWGPTLIQVAIISLLIGLFSLHPALIITAVMAWALFGDKLRNKEQKK
jgi:hypothetical protein